MKIFNIKDKLEYAEEIAVLTQKEWGDCGLTGSEFKDKVNKKIEKIKASLENNNYCKLIFLDDENLVGFISIFPTDGDEEKSLTPWYATMYVKTEYRGKGYSKVLNDAILVEAKKRGFKKLYLKTELVNYYEKFGAKYIKDLKSGERLLWFEIEE